MSSQQLAQVLGAIQGLGNQMDAMKAEFRTRLDNLERRVTNIEGAIVRLAGPGTLADQAHPSSSYNMSSNHRHLPLAPPVTGPSQNAQPSRVPGSRENASFLPFVIEAIAKKAKNRDAHDDRKCGYCGLAPTFDIECFRLEHYHWCRTHSRPCIHPHANCGRDYQGCERIRWEEHRDWKTIVNMSYASGRLGNQGIANLDELLFPRNLYPKMYERDGNFRA